MLVGAGGFVLQSTIPKEAHIPERHDALAETD